MPRPDNAAVLAADAITRLASPGPRRVTPVMARFLELAATTMPTEAARVLRGLASDDAPTAERAASALTRACDPMYARALDALLRDTISPDVVHAGIKYNVIPGEAVIEVDARILPGTTESQMRATVVDRLGPALAGASEIELLVFGAPVEAPADGALFELLVSTLVEHDPEAIPLPAMVPFATDAKHTQRLGVSTYGFSPLMLDPDERFLELFHGVDERVSVAALRWGLPVLYDVVRRFCG
jgi:acetylornithine deacetylase/succinyl-diaminopimelate desuccinylase-like protein